MTADARFMRRAVRWAQKGLGRTSPNPPVGAVVVHAGQIVGAGFHRRAGAPHAEVEALRAAGERAADATLYVTLEPCAHHGRTPPCVEAVLRAGLRRVVVGTPDPNPNVRGGGLELLRNAGVDVVVGIEREACEELISPFRKRVLTGRSHVTLKMAATLDGRTATVTGESRWISCETSRRLVHRLRNECDAVMVGAGTVLADDPELTCRLPGGRDPLRVIVDGRLRVAPTARVFTDGRGPGTILATAVRAARRLAPFRDRGVRILTLPGPNGRMSLADLTTELARLDVSSVLLEGGGDLAAAALRECVVDRILLFLSPLLVGADGVPLIGPLGVRHLADAVAFDRWRARRVGSDFMFEGWFRESR